MTGFGDASAQEQGIHFAVEVRSLNNRYFKPTIRLPEPISGLEAELETLLRKKLIRGSITLTARMMASGSAAISRVNDEALVSYLEHLETIRARVSSDQAVTIDLTALMTLPGVLAEAEDDVSLVQKCRGTLTKLVDQACERLLEMRRTEGDALSAEFATHLKLIEKTTAKVAERAPVVVEEYHQRLQTRVDELIARAKLEVDKVDLVREVAIFADRADITEELARTRGHLEHFRKILDADGNEPAGRTLDFIAQELLREANTIASKSNDAEISRAMVEVKSSIDRIKEQVQNVE